MSNLDKTEFIWPPRGWMQLKKVENLSGSVIVKDPVFAKVSSLFYEITPTPVISKRNQNKFSYYFQIDGWEYDINNNSREFPVLSFVVKERVSHLTNHFLLSEIKSNGRPMKSTQIISHRILMAAIHFIREIDKGNAPAVRDTLLLYKVHPCQKRLYSERNNKALKNIMKNLLNNVDNNNAAKD